MKSEKPRSPQLAHPEGSPPSAAPPPDHGKPIVIPSILLEGDFPPPPSASGPGQRFALGPQTAAGHQPALQEVSALPEGYGSERLFLTARDPHWIYAAWDLTAEQQRRYNAQSIDGHLLVRVSTEDAGGQASQEIHVHPESKSWFVHVGSGGVTCTAELGYRDYSERWHSIALSDPARTPPDAPAAEQKIEFATVPAEVDLKRLSDVVRHALDEPAAPPKPSPAPPAEPAQLPEPMRTGASPPSAPPLAEPLPAFPKIDWPELLAETEPALETQLKSELAAGSAEIVPPSAPEQVPLIEAVQRLRAAGWREAPEVGIQPPPPWTAAQAKAIEEAGHLFSRRHSWIGSLEIVEQIRRQLLNEVSSAEMGAATPGIGVSSPRDVPGIAAEQPFWFNLNAELILYGATEPDAQVTVGGREIRLRPDGTFSFRFALPDGQYPLSIQAVSATRAHSRAAHLEFGRRTQWQGDVGRHPQDEALKPPLPDHIS